MRFSIKDNIQAVRYLHNDNDKNMHTYNKGNIYKFTIVCRYVCIYVTRITCQRHSSCSFCVSLFSTEMKRWSHINNERQSICDQVAGPDADLFS